MNPFDHDSLEKFGEFWKKKRVKAGYSQLEISDILGYQNSQFVSNCERGLSLFPITAQAKLLSIYDVPIKEWVNLYIREYKKQFEATLKNIE